MKAIPIKEIGIRLGEDGKMRLSMDPRAYKGPRHGDFPAYVFNAREHTRLADMTKAKALWNQGQNESAAVPNLELCTNEQRRQSCILKKQNDKPDIEKKKCTCRSCFKPIVRLQGTTNSNIETKPLSSDVKNSSSQNLDTGEKLERIYLGGKSVDRKSNGQRTSRSNSPKQMRPHRALMVHRMSKQTNKSLSKVVKSMLDLQQSVCDPDAKIRNSHRSIRSHEVVMTKPDSSPSLSSRRRVLLYEALRSSSRTSLQESSHSQKLRYIPKSGSESKNVVL
eukprot:CAMPEP_0184490954 /NCGR_PEP_ID=MMETSP0113_2-20130426/19274_1 /TAXON_ID=91329 /ORGANISM="Norrisiella sphaerica, Strain BC52" /LENGTH=278 /DNA_ID=CAMNT_0026875099 /DNA_START=302 /DNA_END=1138 /DNA_ORIENTATION=-